MSDDDTQQQTHAARIPEPRERPGTEQAERAGESTGDGSGAPAAPAAEADRRDDEPRTDAVDHAAVAGAEDRATDRDEWGPDEPGEVELERGVMPDAGSSVAHGVVGEPAPQAVSAEEARVVPDERDDLDQDSAEPDDLSPRPVAAPRRRAAAGLRASVLIGILFALLGFGLAVQVRTNSSTSGLSSARQEDLVRILDDLSSREDRLRQQISSLESARSKLLTSGDKASVALSEARNRSATLGILAGTAPARGPGVQITINDPGHKLDAEDLLDAVEELRAAGAEAFQVGRVRVGVSSAFTDAGGGVLADGVRLDPPYVILAIGDPGTLATALNIPGGVVASVRNAGGQAVVEQREHLVIDAVRPVKTPQFASPAPKDGN